MSLGNPRMKMNKFVPYSLFICISRKRENYKGTCCVPVSPVKNRRREEEPFLGGRQYQEETFSAERPSGAARWGHR